MSTGNLRTRPLLRGTAVVVGLVLLAGCTSEGATGEGSSVPQSTFESSYVEPELQQIAPLRGTPVETGELQTPALSVKIPNVDYPGGPRNAARPQWGIGQADVIYEQLVEGGLTRYVVQFHSEVPDVIGPVRSIRPMDPAIIAPAGGLVAYSGGKARFRRLMSETDVKNITEGNAAYFRSPERNAPNNLLLNAADLVEANADLAAPDQQFSFAKDQDSATAVTQGEDVSEAITNFSNSSHRSWEYSDDDGVWLRFQGSEEDVDHDGERVQAVNLIVLKVDVDRQRFAQLSGAPPFTLFKGEGEAWFSTGGKYVAGTWSKGNASDRVEFTDENGFPVQLAPGNTWIELIPNDTGEFSYQ